jgi:demethylmenaquinone methyltransferase/2-methoxy-6-polyprenyl-1,4-benzoquinol methylase
MNRAKAEFFDTMATAPWAAEPFRPEDRPKITRLLTAAEIRPGARVLEPGCGTGRLTEILADAVGPTGQVLALDISTKMARACRDRMGQRQNVQVLQGAMEECPVEAEMFDLAVCHQVFPHFDAPATALAALAQSLKRGGRLLVVHFTNAAVINEIHRTAAAPIQHDRLPPPAEMRRLLAAAGLSVDWYTDDSLGYLVRGIRPSPASN